MDRGDRGVAGLPVVTQDDDFTALEGAAGFIAIRVEIAAFSPGGPAPGSVPEQIGSALGVRTPSVGDIGAQADYWPVSVNAACDGRLRRRHGDTGQRG